MLWYAAHLARVEVHDAVLPIAPRILDPANQNADDAIAAIRNIIDTQAEEAILTAEPFRYPEIDLSPFRREG